MSDIIRTVDADVVESTLAPIIDNALTKAAALAAAIVDDSSRADAVAMGVEVKTAIVKIEAEREEVYEPLAEGVERLRNKFDDRIKKGKAILKTLSGGVGEYDNKKRREAELLRERAEAEARRVQQEAEKKRQEAAVAAALAQKAIDDEKRRVKEAQEAEERRVAAEAAEKTRLERVRREAEQAELDRKRAEEEKARLDHAQVAEEVGNGEARIDNVLGSVTPIAPTNASPQRDIESKQLAAEQMLADKTAQEKAEAERKETEAAAVRQAEATAAAEKAQREAEEAQAAADAAIAAATAVTATRPDKDTRKSTNWKWQVRNTASFLALAKAVVEGRAPVEYLGWNPDKPEKFRPAIIGKDVVDKKEEFRCDGIETWPEVETHFKAAA